MYASEIMVRIGVLLSLGYLPARAAAFKACNKRNASSNFPAARSDIMAKLKVVMSGMTPASGIASSNDKTFCQCSPLPYAKMAVLKFPMSVFTPEVRMSSNNAAAWAQCSSLTHASMAMLKSSASGTASSLCICCKSATTSAIGGARPSAPICLSTEDASCVSTAVFSGTATLIAPTSRLTRFLLCLLRATGADGLDGLKEPTGR
mmetsp:Transcript_10452/g.19263  ORF Transcript_10452/g.19263 Transcript_10452/m.19263 type:complete len:205 (+) Transcript_10452:1560-2174(+)